MCMTHVKDTSLFPADQKPEQKKFYLPHRSALNWHPECLKACVHNEASRKSKQTWITHIWCFCQLKGYLWKTTTANLKLQIYLSLQGTWIRSCVLCCGYESSWQRDKKSLAKGTLVMQQSVSVELDTETPHAISHHKDNICFVQINYH